MKDEGKVQPRQRAHKIFPRLSPIRPEWTWLHYKKNKKSKVFDYAPCKDKHIQGHKINEPVCRY